MPWMVILFEFHEVVFVEVLSFPSQIYQFKLVYILYLFIFFSIVLSGVFVKRGKTEF